MFEVSVVIDLVARRVLRERGGIFFSFCVFFFLIFFFPFFCFLFFAGDNEKEARLEQKSWRQIASLEEGAYHEGNDSDDLWP